jgi:protein PhnA
MARGRSSIPGKSVLESIGRGVLDAPPSRGMTTSFAGKHHMDIKVRNSNGAQLAEGDTVTLIKDLKLKGSSTVLKRGTVIKNIHLTDDPDEIEGRTDEGQGPGAANGISE